MKLKCFIFGHTWIVTFGEVKSLDAGRRETFNEGAKCWWCGIKKDKKMSDDYKALMAITIGVILVYAAIIWVVCLEWM